MFEVTVQNRLSFNWANHSETCAHSSVCWWFLFSPLENWLHDDDVITYQDIYKTAQAINVPSYTVEVKLKLLFQDKENTKIQPWNVIILKPYCQKERYF